MSEIAKGKGWLAERLAAVGNGKVWRDAKLTLFERGVAVMAEAVPDSTSPRERLTNSEVVQCYSVRLRARDNATRKIVETWLRGVTLQRIVIRARPTRDGISHDRYTVIMQWLCREGVVVRTTGPGYAWAEAFGTMASRAEWLIDTLRNKGEIRVSAHGRFILMD